MSLRITRAGLQTTVQAAPRQGRRGQGMPTSGPADALSMALANRLLDNPPWAPSLEITLGVVTLVFYQPTQIALTGAVCDFTINNQPREFPRSLQVQPKDKITLGAPRSGMRTYLAVSGGFHVAETLGSASTYLPAGLGGIEGRALQDGDELAFTPRHNALVPCETPPDIRRDPGADVILRVVPSVEFKALSSRSRKTVFTNAFTAARQIDRMGIRMKGPPLDMWPGSGQLASSAVFPGTIQCPEGGEPIILGPDAQTTGGYPRILSVIAADRHLIGQVRPGSTIQLIYQTLEQAEKTNRQRAAHLATWLPQEALLR